MLGFLTLTLGLEDIVRVGQSVRPLELSRQVIPRFFLIC